MIIRLAVINDLPQVMQLIKAIVPQMNASGNMQWDENYPNETVFKKDIELKQLWVAEIEGNIAGITAITTDQEPEYAALGWNLNETAIVTHRLAVSPKYQGKGVAASLLLQAERCAIAKNIPILRVDTNSMNQATQKLFPKLGYVFAGEITLDFRPGLLFYGYEKRLDKLT